MKILFVNPMVSDVMPGSSRRKKQKWKKFVNGNPAVLNKVLFTKKTFNGLGLITIASLVDDGIEKVFIDENMEKIDYDVKCDLVAIGGHLWQIESALRIIKEFKRKMIPVVVGGPAAKGAWLPAEFC